MSKSSQNVLAKAVIFRSIKFEVVTHMHDLIFAVHNWFMYCFLGKAFVIKGGIQAYSASHFNSSFFSRLHLQNTRKQNKNESVAFYKSLVKWLIHDLRMWIDKLRKSGGK